MQVNINYFLDEHAWSTCLISTVDKNYEMSITHIYQEDPIEDCIHALTAIMNGESKSQFVWYGEPGGERITITEIPHQKSMVHFKVQFSVSEYGKELKDFEEGIQFDIKKIQLVRMFYFEFKKIFELMKDPEYEEHRKNHFPFKGFRAFEKLAVEYLGLKSL